MNILAIESSCDDTAAAVVRDGRTVLSSRVSSQIEMHTVYGGVVPEIASRKHVEAISGLADLAWPTRGWQRPTWTLSPSPTPPVSSVRCWWGELRQGAARSLGLPLIPRPPCAGAHRRQLSHPPRPGAPLRLSVCVRGNHRHRGRADLHRDVHAGGAPGTTRRGSASTRWPECWASATPAGPPWTNLPRGETTRDTSCPWAHVAGAELDMSFSGLKTASLNLIHNAQQKEEALDLPSFAASFRPGGE